MEEKIEQIASKRGYVVTEDGILLNPNSVEIGYNDSGYITTSIRIKGKSKHLKAHRLQAYQKYGDSLYEDGVVTRHLNSNSEDNSWDNIIIGTQSDNMMDIPEQIRIKKALHATSFVRKHNKKEIKKFHSIDNSYRKTMDEFGITSKGTLHYILNS